jgi:CheY-like chemotaxis protein
MVIDMEQPNPNHTGLLVSRDLIFTSKIKGTADALGYRLVVAGNQALAVSSIETSQPRLILIDLTAGDIARREALEAYRQTAGPEVWLVAFGPHVDVESLAMARSAGCQLVLPRSKLAAELPELLRQYFEKPPGSAA